MLQHRRDVSPSQPTLEAIAMAHHGRIGTAGTATARAADLVQLVLLGRGAVLPAVVLVLPEARVGRLRPQARLVTAQRDPYVDGLVTRRTGGGGCLRVVLVLHGLLLGRRREPVVLARVVVALGRVVIVVALRREVVVEARPLLRHDGGRAGGADGAVVLRRVGGEVAPVAGVRRRGRQRRVVPTPKRLLAERRLVHVGPALDHTAATTAAAACTSSSSASAVVRPPGVLLPHLELAQVGAAAAAAVAHDAEPGHDEGETQPADGDADLCAERERARVGVAVPAADRRRRALRQQGVGEYAALDGHGRAGDGLLEAADLEQGHHVGEVVVVARA